MQASIKMKVSRREEGNGIGIDVLTTAKPGSPAYTRGEFGVCWAGEGAFEQLLKK